MAAGTVATDRGAHRSTTRRRARTPACSGPRARPCGPLGEAATPALIDPLSLAIAGTAAVASVALAVLQWPRPPALDGERWLKVSLATLLRGQVQAADGDVDAWEAAVRDFVPYHPAGRFPERKVSNPEAASLSEPALPGERALVEALAGVRGHEARWARLYDDDEAAIEARLGDPAELGAAYDPRTTLGPEATWDALAAWGGGDPGFVTAVRRALPATWVLVSGRADRLGGPSMLPSLAAEAGQVELLSFDAGELEERLHRLAREGRVMVLVGEEAGIVALLDVLARNLAVRDATAAVLSIGGPIRGCADDEGPYSRAVRQDWMDAWFTVAALETEVVRLTPYFSLQWLDRAVWPPGVEGQPLELARFPVPDAKGATATTTEVVDLGVLPAREDLPVELVARALVTVVTAWVVHRR